MASARPVLSPELANNVIKLYRECLRRASTFREPYRDFITIITQTQFRANMHETDPAKIQECKDKAIKGVVDHMIFAAEREASKRTEQRTEQV